MRYVPLFAFFLLCIALVACAGGGASGRLVPAGTAPSSAAAGSGSGRTAMRLYVPPASAQNPASKHRLYISPNTESFAVWVVPAASPQATPLSSAQVFPIATPSPCAAASGGGYLCTLQVTAPFGNDNFYVAAYAIANPSANTTPLSIYGPAAEDVSSTPNPSASPLSFSLNAVPATIALDVQNPDPGNTPQTQVFTVASPGSAQLYIQIKDASGYVIAPDATASFSPAITIDASPSTAGISLQLNSECGAANASGSSVKVSCAADLDNVQLAYSGAVEETTSDQVIDNMAITASSSFASPAPSPAYAVLQSNALATPVPLPGGFYPYDAWLTPNGNAMIYLMTDDEQTYAGTYSPASGTVGAPQLLNGVVYPSSAVVAADGSYWLVDENSSVIDCWPSYADATTGTGFQQIPAPPVGSSDAVEPQGIAADGSGDIWYVGYDESFGQEYAGYFPSGGCAQPGTFPTPFALAGDQGSDYSTNVVGLTSGIAYSSTSSGVYIVNSSGVQSTYTPQLGASSSGGGVAVDGAQTVYAGFANYQSSTGDIENVTQSKVLSSLAPTSPIDGDGPDPGPLAAFSPAGGAADRLAYIDQNFGVLGMLLNVNSTPSLAFANMPNAFYGLWQTAYGANGFPYVIYENIAGGISIGGAISTDTWNIPVTSVNDCGENPAVFAIQERGDSGPFTWSFPGSSGGSATQFPGNDHLWAVTPPSYGTPFTVVVTDSNGHGRSETYQLTVSTSCPG